MLKLRHLMTILFVILAGWAAYGQGDVQNQGVAELLALHQANRRAHFNHDVSALLAHTAPLVIDVRDGKVTVLSHKDLAEKFEEYFHRAEFSAWDDVQAPVAHVSNDGRTGWMIVRVRIAYTENSAGGKKVIHDETMAWMSAYERQNGKWMMTAVTSTSDQH